MKLKFFKIQRIIKKNLEFAFLLLTIIVTILSVRIYNVNKNVINQVIRSVKNMLKNLINQWIFNQIINQKKKNF